MTRIRALLATDICAHGRALKSKDRNFVSVAYKNGRRAFLYAKCRRHAKNLLQLQEL